ncbi:hypothetical protein CNT_KDOLBLKC_00088 [Bacillus subtilis]|nr:Transcriptional repressor SdpR [Bacillus subtilis]
MLYIDWKNKMFYYLGKYLNPNVYQRGENYLNKAFKALADPTRRRILDLLKQQDLTAGQIADQFDMSKPSISHHLNILKNTDLVRDQKKGQFIIYSLNTTVLQDLISWFFSLTDTDHDKKEGGE